MADKRGFQDLDAFRKQLGDSFVGKQIHVGSPRGDGWIASDELMDASSGPFGSLLAQIGERAKTGDRKIIAAAFAARLGWSSVVALAPLLLAGKLPKLRPDGYSLQFSPQTLFTAIALEQADWSVSSKVPENESCQKLVCLKQIQPLYPELSEGLHRQITPVVEALYDWSRFSRRGAWGQIYASWGSVFKMVADYTGQSGEILPYLHGFFSGPMDHPAMAPDFYSLAPPDDAHIFHRRASCCLYYRLPQGSLCASCPLETDENRLAANRASLIHV